jgi:hypothetical protein
MYGLFELSNFFLPLAAAGFSSRKESNPTKRRYIFGIVAAPLLVASNKKTVQSGDCVVATRSPYSAPFLVKKMFA